MLNKIFWVVPFVFVIVSANASILDRHRVCEVDDDCTLTHTGGCCGPDTPINRKFSKDFIRPTDKRCKSAKVACKKEVAFCDNGQCSKKEITSEEMCTLKRDASWCELFQKDAERRGNADESAKWKKLKCALRSKSWSFRTPPVFSDCE